MGLDSCVIPTRHHGFYLVQTTDLYPFIEIYDLYVLIACILWCFDFDLCSFYPLVEDPYMQVSLLLVIYFIACIFQHDH